MHCYLCYNIKLEDYPCLDNNVNYRFPHLPPSLRYFRLVGFVFLVIYIIGYFAVTFYLRFKIFNNYCT